MGMPTRRSYLTALGSGVAVTLGGCLGGVDSTTDDSGSDSGADPGSEDADEAGGENDGNAPPTADRSLPLPDDTSALLDSIVSGGVGQDGIPSIDDPAFVDVDAADDWLAEGEPVFGYVRNGDARAYPQRVLVWHEIVNDTVDGDPVAITYCPLTGTVQGFERGDVEFGVSGKLLNSNLVMYDRATDSYWPQMLATGISGPHEGDVLHEFQVTWTSWGRWREAYSDTAVLSDDTGFARNYDQDPYGSYNPPSGHYEDDSLLFPPYDETGAFDEYDLPAKKVVVGARSEDGAVAFGKDRLREDEVIETTVDDVPYVAVYDSGLDTGYVYRNPDERSVDHDGETVVVNGDDHAPTDLPLDRVIRYDAMWFAWGGYYPQTEVVA